MSHVPVLRPYLSAADHVIWLARGRFCALKLAAVSFWCLRLVLWLTECSPLGTGRICDCLARPPGSNGNIPWEESASGVSGYVDINSQWCKGKKGSWSKTFCRQVDSRPGSGGRKKFQQVWPHLSNLSRSLRAGPGCYSSKIWFGKGSSASPSGS